jgi:phosphoheptose isomerase
VTVERLRALADLATAGGRGTWPARLPELVAVAATALAGGGKLMFCGNGGSAADAQHLATEYVVRFRDDRDPLPALALTTDTSLLTAAGNDYGFEHVFARQVLALGRKGDVLFLHSTSGRSPNLLRAAEAAREKGCPNGGAAGPGRRPAGGCGGPRPRRAHRLRRSGAGAPPRYWTHHLSAGGGTDPCGLT